MRFARHEKFYEKLENQINSFKPTRDQRFVDEAEMYQSSLHSFIKGSWPTIEGGREFIDGWHLQALCEHLEAVYYGQIRNLLINVPPRTMKSTAFSVGFPSWCWTKDPSLQFLYLSYVSRLTIRDSVKCRRIIDSRWYQERWGHRFQLCGDVNTKLRFDNNRSGYRIATSIGGAGTGEGGDIIGVDDPNNAGETESDVIRENTNDWCDHVLSTRLNNPKTGRIVVVQQRLHSQDYSGHVLAKHIPDMVHLCLPMEYEEARKCITVPTKSTRGLAWKDPRTQEGELLWPERFGWEEVDKLKKSMNSEYVVAGQLQQRPAPAEGGIIKKGWWQWWKETNPPQCDFVLQSWDTAFSTGADACYSACVNLGVFNDRYGVSNVILLSTFRAKMENPDLRRMMLRLANNYYDNKYERPKPENLVCKPDMILVEAGANGMPLIQDLRRAGLIINKFDPRKATGYRDNDKIFRAKIFSHIIESGKVWVPARPPHYTSLLPFADTFVEACAMFPNDESNDFVDAMMQGLAKLLSSGLINNPEDIHFSAPYNPKQEERFY
jgi:phage terminase large subunit-like protein